MTRVTTSTTKPPVRAGGDTELELPAAGEVRQLLELAEERSVREFENPDGSITRFYRVREGLELDEREALNPKLPDFVAASETLVEPDSFIGYVNQFKSSTAICRASLSHNSIVAVLDYHGRAREGDRDAAVPGRCAHQVTLSCPFDPDWARWRAAFGKPLGQKDFAEFIEDGIHTIHAPPAADLLEAIADMKIERKVHFTSARNDRNGNTRFTYDEVDDEQVEGTLTVPELVTLVISIFQGGPAISLDVRVRYRMDKGVLAFILSVPGLGKIERDAFRAIGERVRSETATPVFYAA